MFQMIDLEALADFLEYEVDCSADYEEDCFGLTFRDHQFYVERHPTHFRIEHSAMAYELPRC